MKKIKQEKMVGWYNPCQLIRTGLEVFISTLFGRHADRRLLQSAATPHSKPFEEPFKDKFEDSADFWLDYIADVGDGFDSTYTMAYYSARKTLDFNNRLQSDAAGEIKTKRGNLLIFGGDEIYPTASFENYQKRLVEPYKAAFPQEVTDDSPIVFAIPGNHDWYDSLVSFSGVFQEGKPFAGWKTAQKRSYFAVKLIRGWWLFGTDMQLGSSLDKPQIDYFTEAVKHLAPGDTIILCHAEPHWIFSKIHESDEGNTSRATGFFEGQILKDRVAVYLAGDLHHYRRHERTDGKKQRITAGGGGAFLHPTHGDSVETLGKRSIYKLKESFPEPNISRRLCQRNVWFPVSNPLFGAVTGLVYLLTAQAFRSDIGTIGLNRIGEAVHTVVIDALTKPFALFWVLLILGGFILFTDTHSKLYRFLMSPIHGLVHLAAAFFVAWGVSFQLSDGHGIDPNSIGQMLFAGLLIFIVGWIVSSFIMGFYLLISLNVFGRHSNEAFSSLAVADYKNFLRMKIDRNGDLTIYPIGVRRVARKWNNRTTKDEDAKIVPDDSRATAPELIEKPFTVRKLEPRSPRKAAAKSVEDNSVLSAQTEINKAV